VTAERHRFRRAAGLAALVVLLASCATDSVDPATPPAGPHAPTAPASRLTPQDATGETIDLEGAGSIVAPSGSTVEGPSTTANGSQQLNIRMPDADDSGLPAVQVTWGADTVGVYEQSWTAENAAKVDGTISDYVRAAAQWPGSAESVVATWTEKIALTTDGSLDVSATRLTVQDDDGTTVIVLALTPEGEMADSDAERVLRSLTLG